MSLLYVSEHSKHFLKLRNWDWCVDPPTLLGTIPKFDHFFKSLPLRLCEAVKRYGCCDICSPTIETC